MTIGVGTTITHGTDRYEVTRTLGSGGFGSTFVAVRRSPDRTPVDVVIKVPAPHVLTDPIWAQKFAREARILANVHHPNVVRIIAYWEFAKSGEKALVQELVLGAKELPDYIAGHPDSTGSLLLQTLYAMHAFHSAASPAAVHRDLSPRNILVSDSGVIKVIDFGLAKEDPRATQTLTLTGDSFGTPGCMSPEQVADAGSVDHRTDLFAVGRSFAAALQRRHPQVARPDKLAEPWKTLCMKLAEDDRDDRPANAEAATSEVFREMLRFGAKLEHLAMHAVEMSKRVVLAGWPELCERELLAMGDFDQAAVRLMESLSPGVFAPSFDAPKLFDLLEKSSAVANVSSGSADFEDADPLGVVYARLYRYLDPARKMACFARVCKAAVLMHRYSVMQDVRVIYGAESNPAIQAQLVSVLNTEDPRRAIEGRGVLPRTP